MNGPGPFCFVSFVLQGIVSESERLSYFPDTKGRSEVYLKSLDLCLHDCVFWCFWGVHYSFCIIKSVADE